MHGVIRNGHVQAEATLEAYEGQDVLITLSGDEEEPTDFDALELLVKQHQVDASLEDLAREHNHYRLGVPKNENAAQDS